MDKAMNTFALLCTETALFSKCPMASETACSPLAASEEWGNEKFVMVREFGNMLPKTERANQKKAFPFLAEFVAGGGH